MIGRAAQGRPWIFREIRHFLTTEKQLPKPAHAEVRDIMLAHLDQLYAFYGEQAGVRVARKHLGWYRDAAVPAHQSQRDVPLAATSADALFRELRVAETAAVQLTLARAWLDAAAGDAPAAGGHKEPEPGARAPTAYRPRQRAEVA